jgi:hypothetical protein
MLRSDVRRRVMKTIGSWSLTCFLLVISAIQAVRAADKPDFQKIADETQWSWSDRYATLLGCIDQKRHDDYDVTVSFTSANRHQPTITIGKDKNVIYSWPGHEYSVFHIQNDILYYALFG